MHSRVNRLVDIVKYVSSSTTSAYYVGWVGYDNLGDEAIFDACAKAFYPVQMSMLRPLSNSILNDLINRKRVCALLGGGTQIGEPSPINWFRYGVEKYGTGIVFGTGVTPVKDDLIPDWLYEWGSLLNRCHYVGVRGEDSAITLSKVGVKAEVLGDTACVFSQELDFYSPREKTIGVNIGQSGGHVYGSESDIVNKMSKFINNVVAMGWSVEFFCVWPDDYDVTKETARLSGIVNPVIHCEYKNAYHYLTKVKTMSVFVGMKLHSVVLAHCANVPSVMLEYRPKCQEYMRSVGMVDYCVRDDIFDHEGLISLVHHLYDAQHEVAKNLNERVGWYKNKILNKAAQLAGDILRVV